jgi:hypothetical protein
MRTPEATRPHQASDEGVDGEGDEE